ncbi:MAG: M1 family metallopeptidase, partial [Gemmatimonadaceae bacterium]
MTNAIRRAFAAGTRDSTGRPGGNYWQLRTDYVIQAALEPATSRITGTERVTVYNNSPDTLRQIGLRLDPNLFMLQNPHAQPWVPAEETDGMVISALAVDGQTANLGATASAFPPSVPPSVPTLANAKSTVARVNLAKWIPPKSSATLEISWSFKVPGGPGQGHRMTMRWADTLYQPTQWYPRVQVYDDLRGWDSELYLGPSEFYNNFGRFDVTITAPGGWIVVGTGVLQNPQEVLTPQARERLSHVLESDSVVTVVGPDESGRGQATAAGDRLSWHFVADTVNDFAWATAAKYVLRATRATIPGKGPVPIYMAHLPGRAPQYANAGSLARHALEYYSKLWFPYPFPQLTLQDGPSAGMEYPMVINSNQGAADHETGHQWWPMTVSNNETWYGWMDEGFNQYMNVLSAADRAGKAAEFDGAGQSYGATSGNESEPPMMWNANYDGPSFYGFTTYSKTPLMLSMLGGIVGDSAVQRAHRAWAQAWMFKHPSPWDYMFYMNHALG